MRGILAAGIICAIVAFISGSKTTPEQVVNQYLQYTFMDNNGEKAYSLLSADDKKYVSKEEFDREIKKNNVLNKQILKEYEEFFNYEITGTRRSADTIYVEVEMTKPNALNVLREMVGYAMLTAFSTMTEEQQNQAIENKFKNIMMSKDRLTVTSHQTFILIPEGEGYKIYLNLGRPHKVKELEAKLFSLEFRAEEQIRLIDFEGALQTYREMVAMAPHSELKKDLDKVEKIVHSTAAPGENIVRGYLKFTPKLIKIEPLNLTPDRPARDYLTMRFSVKNVSEGEVFEITDDDMKQINMINGVRDNFGNAIKGVKILPYGHSDSTFTVAPGESKEFMAVCEKPLSKAAEKFLWELRLVTTNRGSIKPFLVSFSKKDLKDSHLMLAYE